MQKGVHFCLWWLRIWIHLCGHEVVTRADVGGEDFMLLFWRVGVVTLQRASESEEVTRRSKALCGETLARFLPGYRSFNGFTNKRVSFT